MIVDSHQHFWKYNPIKDSWIDSSMKILQSDFFPQDLKPILETNNIDGCIAVQADQSEEETKFLLSLAENNEFIKGVVGWVDLRANNIDKRLSYFSSFQKFKGVRHIIQNEAEDFVLNRDFQYGISRLEKFNLTYDILVYPNQLSNTILFVSNFPNQTFILNHIGKPNIKNKELDTWKEHIIHLSTFKNVYCKISGLVTEAHWSQWEYDEFIPYLDVVFNSFGTDRILFGSDWPVCLLAAKYEDVFQIINNYISSFSEKDKYKIYGENAIKIYSL